MRVFYIFKIKDEFKNIYHETPSVLYNIFKQIYYLGSDEASYARTIVKQLTNINDKEVMDRELFIKLHKNFSYSKNKDTHILNNLYKDEISKLVIKKTYIRIESSISSSSFFKELIDFSEDFFVCCFTYSDFFFIDSLKMLVN